MGMSYNFIAFFESVKIKNGRTENRSGSAHEQAFTYIMDIWGGNQNRIIIIS